MSSYGQQNRASAPAKPAARKAPAQTSPTALAEALAAELKQCSPVVDPKDMQARDKSSLALRNSALFRDCMNESVLWGVRPTDGQGYNPDLCNLTKFDSYVYRAMYLSLFMFSGEHTVTQSDGYVVLHAACDFRGKMDPGSYPYPFWHKPAKWTDYQICKNIDFVFEQNRIIAVYRSVEKKTDVALVAREFDGNWTWTSPDGKRMPYVSLFNYILSSKNPHRNSLEQAYRAFALESRKHQCMECHSPDNKAKVIKLILLNYPNQALGARHDLLSEIESNTMPPKTDDHPAGISDPADRQRLLDLARRFAETGDQALAFEAAKRARQH